MLLCVLFFSFICFQSQYELICEVDVQEQEQLTEGYVCIRMTLDE